MLLVSWLNPWQLLQFEAVPNSFVLPLNILSEFNLVNPTGVTKGARLITPLSEQTTTPLLIFYWLWLAAFAIGLILLFKDIVSYIKLRRHWIKHSTLDNQAWGTAQLAHPNCDIRRINTQAPGMITGLIKLIIWLESGQHEVEKIRTIVLHELTHIRQHDPYWLWAIN
jgi:beta-lactamase regulating signal transducer with metallopeptidase domain